MSDRLRSDIFREVNERIAEISGMWEWEEKQGFLCECATAHCTQAVWLTRAEYASIRAVQRRFLTAPGHETVGDGRVVERRGDYVVIEASDVGALVSLEDLHRQA
jgi:hypothetical protein